MNRIVECILWVAEDVVKTEHSNQIPELRAGD